ncbi:MAG: hypothetical protein CSYNP_01149 [Syntrophus sp. SKADARSKE-3]|nr:hypothetical protein [Syntrophus sp. SKADARSKE-3]
MSQVIREENIVFLNHDNVYRKEENGAYLYDPETGTLKYLNRTGVQIVDLCDGKKNIRDLVDMMQAIYPDEISTKLREDVIDFINRLVDDKYLIMDRTKHVNRTGDE